IYTLGSTIGGGTPVELESSSNTVTGLIENVTLELNQAQADTSVTIDVAVDVDGMVEDVEKFVNRYSDIVKFFNTHFRFDEETGLGGELFGENFAMRLNQSVRQKVTDIVQGLGQQLTSLAALGVRTANDGTLSVDASQLRTAVESDPDSLVNLFSTSGSTTDSDVQFLVASSKTQSSYLFDEDGYEINITAAASKAMLTAESIVDPSELSPLVIDSSNDSFRITLDDRESTVLSIASGSYTSGGQLAAAIEDAINNDDDLRGSTISVEYMDDGGGNGHFEFTSLQYGSGSGIEFSAVEENSIYSSIGVTAGVLARGTNVAGTINGEEATGAGRYLAGDIDNEYTAGLQVLVTITADQLAIQGGSQGTVKVTKGVATRVTEYINDLVELETGAISAKKNAIETINETMEGEMDHISARIEKKERRLFNQFVQLETAIAQFQAQENYLTSMISQLQGLTNYWQKK
ncbi:MAG: flagellar filament capping protein FliD, partial [Bacteroidales bacterium]|nr:flagellar filament capping protein FliD [Candidatus Latescibacterota bacterium]